jgi:hypothetical protein
MGSRVSDSKAKQLLELALKESDRLKRHLYVAAGLREVLEHRPVVVGGTAEEYWTRDDYHETDLDVCVPLTQTEEDALLRLGFERAGRYWELTGERSVVLEFPEPRIDGDEERVVEEAIGPGSFAMIGLDDLYLDRLRQTTATMNETDVHFQSALAVAAARFEDIDWTYVARRIEEEGGQLGAAMRKMDSRVRAKIRRRLSEPT